MPADGTCAARKKGISKEGRSARPDRQLARKIYTISSTSSMANALTGATFVPFDLEKK
jgi:hypothetical protein